MSLWQGLVQNVANTPPIQGIQSALQQYGFNRQQDVPLMMGGTGNSVIKALTSGVVGPAQASMTPQPGGGGGGGGGGSDNYMGPNQVTSPPTSSGGGGGGDTRLQELEKINRNPVQETEYQQLLDQLRSQAQQGPSEEELNALFNPAMEYLGQAESTLRGQLPQTLDLLGQQADTSRQMLGDQRGSAMAQLGEQGTMSTQRKEDAISAARRLFSELQMANQQRFGGASSAGQAASELRGRELMTNRAGIERDFGQAMRQIEMSKADVDNQYQTGLRTIEDRKQAAINEVNQDFQSKLMEINSQRASTQQAKAAARLELLQDMRNKVFQINLQDFNFKQQLAAQKQAADQQIAQYSSSLQNQVGLGQQAAGQFMQNQPGTATTNFAVGGGSQTMGSPVMRGQIGSDEDQFVGQISPTARRAADLLSSGQFNTGNMLRF
jgi:hypothetical protein